MGFRMRKVLLLYLHITIFLIPASLVLISAPAGAEDIVLTGDQVMVIQNTTYTQTGNILIRDNARLSITGSTLVFNQRYHEEFAIIVEGNSTFEIKNSTIKTGILPNENVEVKVLNEANISFENADWPTCYLEPGGSGGALFTGTVSVSNSRLSQLWFMFIPTGGGTISVSNSELNCITFRFANNYQGDFSDLKPGFHAYWKYKEGNYDITLNKTTYRCIDFHIDGPAQVTVRNSEFFALGSTGLSSITLTAIDCTVDLFALHGFGHCTAQLSNLKKGSHGYWSLADHATGDCVPNVTLENSTIKRGWSVSSFGATLSINDSDIVRLGSYAWNWPPDGSHSAEDITSVSNSTIEEVMLYYSYATLIFDNANLRILDAYLPSDSIIKGSITYTEDAFVRNWVNSVIKRNYPVFLMDQDGNLISGATLHLLNKNGDLVWSGTTDENGKANFDIEFNDNNHSDTWKLEISYNSKKFIRYITLLTSTPIQRYFPDIVIEPTSVEFGNLSVGASSGRVVTIKNAGNIGLIIGTITSPPSPFYKINDNCSGHTLLPGTNCRVTLRFSPTSPGYFNGTFNIPSNDPDESVVTVFLKAIATLPGSWLTPPYQVGTNCISMVADEATYLTPPVSYYFDFVGSPTGGLGGVDSGWQPGTSYTNCNLRVNHKYGYRVKAKDGVNNETAYSTTQYAYTAIQAPTGITFGTITSTSIQVRSTNIPSGLSRGKSGLLIENMTNGTTSGWKRDNTFWTNKLLSSNTSYSFRDKARNGDGIETDYGPSASKYTLANSPGKSSFSNVTRTCIRANWTANGNPDSTQYRCQNITTGADSGWITETYWDSCNLSYGTTYSFRVKAKNEEGIETSWIVLGKQSTVGCVVILKPNGGEMISSGSNYDITWTAYDTSQPITKVKLFYTKDAGVTWNSIPGPSGTTYPPGSYSQSWTVPPVGTTTRTKCKVKVVLKDAKGVIRGSDASDNYFTIEP